MIIYFEPATETTAAKRTLITVVEIDSRSATVVSAAGIRRFNN